MMIRNIRMAYIAGYLLAAAYCLYSLVYLANNKDPLALYITSDMALKLALLYVILSIALSCFSSRIAAVLLLLIFLLNLIVYIDFSNPWNGIIVKVALFYGLLMGVLGSIDYQSNQENFNADNRLKAAGNAVVLLGFFVAAAYAAGVFTNQGADGKHYVSQIKNKILRFSGGDANHTQVMPFKDQRFNMSSGESDESKELWQWKDAEGDYHLTESRPPADAIESKQIK